MSFTAKHYNAVAAIIRTERERFYETADEGNGADSALHNMKIRLSAMFASDNPKFDAERFAANCEPKTTTTGKA
jgi:hypothetical protein